MLAFTFTNYESNLRTKNSFALKRNIRILANSFTKGILFCFGTNRYYLLARTFFNPRIVIPIFPQSRDFGILL